MGNVREKLMHVLKMQESFCSLHKGTNPNQTLLLCYLHWLLHPAPTSAQDGLDTLQLALVVFFLPSISAKTSLALEVGIICNLHWWCFSCAN